ncbi:HU family DNA-binding protein [Deinococcus sp. QL22]|uniref:HU family DNA-binding protein n=1 Tax=Deinococcus sp. QL22 TaxID=2939437 RepID=UPI002017D540|nr:HU family DNA-binding protein [Deinococcus sp. QL22]UQN08263.1 HU family DNA-binding protein [Deinococcus sp. QL22]
MTKKAAKAPAKKPTAKAAPAAQAAPTESNKVGKAQLVDLMADQTTLTKKQSDEVFSGMLNLIVDALKGGKTVGLPGLGTLSVKATSARTGVRPGTSEKIQIPAGKKVAFKVATTLKSSL